MSLIGALNVGKSALAVQQAALQTTGNNIANAGNADYTRQVADVAASRDQQLAPGTFMGTGVDLGGISRQIDEALDGRLRSAASDAAGTDSTAQWLDRIQAAFNELSTQDLSTQMSTFFNSWSALANKPQDVGLRQVVLQDGQATAQQFTALRSRLTQLQGDAGDQLKAAADGADALAQQVARLNAQIVVSEGGAAGSDNSLRDQRDAALKQLSQLMDVKAVPQSDGTVNVYVGSEPLVLGSDSRGVALKQTVEDGASVASVVFKADHGTLNVTSGQIGSLVGVQGQVRGVVKKIDTLAHALIFELNKLHASGQGLAGFQSFTAANAAGDPTVPLDDPRAGLKYTPTNGSFVVHLRQKDSGLETSTLVKVGLTGKVGGTSLNALRDQLNAVDGLSASVQGGKLTVRTTSDQVEATFSQDSSGVLAALGVNNFFTGTDARDIAVSQNLRDDPSLLAASGNGAPGDNTTARAIAGLESVAVGSLNGVSLKDSYQATVNGIAASAASAKTGAEAAASVRQTLEGQRQALSGVSLDEEAINLMRQQRAFQGAARFISAVDDLMKTLLQMT